MQTVAEPMIRQILREFTVLFDRYYMLTALLIAQNSVARQYRDSFLGTVWMLIVPLMQVLVYAIIMPMIMHQRVDSYVLYLVTMFPLWAFLSSSLINSTKSLVMQGETLKRCTVSKTVFPLADVMRHFYTYLISYSVMIFVAMLLTWKWNPYVLLMPVYLIPAFISIAALAIGISFVTPYMRDITECIVVSMSVLFWLTPVVYPIDVVPEHLRGWYYLNPMFILMRPAYSLSYKGEIPGLFDTSLLLLLTGLCVAAGYMVYRLCRRNFVYYL